MKVKFIIACILMILATKFAYAKDIHVPGDYPTIQEGIDAALPGDRVLVAAGTYEENITLKTGIEYIGASVDVTTITASSGYIVTAVSISPKTVFRGFTIDGQSSSLTGISCSSSSPTISNVSIKNTGDYGISCSSSSPTISDVNISAAGIDGIYCYDAFPIISNCEIKYSSSNGIKCASYSSPIIRGSIITQNWGNGVHMDVSSNPNIGTEADPGLNEIFDNGFYEVDSNYKYEIKAELNWWGQSPPNPASFRGNIDYDPWLESSPSKGSIAGTVTDIEGNPLKFGIIIAINNDTKEKYIGFTNGSGYYEISELPAAMYLVICIKKGYSAGIQKVEVEPGKVAPCPFVLEPKLE